MNVIVNEEEEKIIKNRIEELQKHNLSNDEIIDIINKEFYYEDDDDSLYLHIDNLKRLFEENLKMNYNNLRKKVNKTKITLKKEQISDAIEKRKDEKLNNIDPSEYGKRFMVIWECSFDPILYDYYEKNIKILKSKLNNLLDIIDIIEKINSNIDINEEEAKKLVDLDIIIYDKKYILDSDIDRLVITIKNIYSLLNNYDRLANNIESYFYSGIADRLYQSDSYPYEEIQVTDERFYTILDFSTYLPLTEKQKKYVYENVNML